MEALALTVLLSAVLAALAATAFVWDRRNRGDDGLDREALRPLEPDAPRGEEAPADRPL